MKGFPIQGNMSPSIVSNKGVNKSKYPKQKTTQEMEHMVDYVDAAHQDKSPAKKKATTCKMKTLDSAGVFEAAVTGANREINMLFSQYADVLSERASVDASQVKELKDILKEARHLESHLQEKKDHLKHTLALIADKLQG